MENMPEEVRKAAVGVMEGWLAGHPTPDTKIFWFGQDSLSPREFVKECQTNPEMIEHLNSLVDLARRGIDLKPLILPDHWPAVDHFLATVDRMVYNEDKPLSP